MKKLGGLKQRPRGLYYADKETRKRVAQSGGLAKAKKAKEKTA